MGRNICTQEEYAGELLLTLGPGNWQYVGKWTELDTTAPTVVGDGFALPGGAQCINDLILVVKMNAGTNYDITVYGYVSDGVAAGNVTGWYIIYTVNTLTASLFKHFNFSGSSPFFPKITRVDFSMDASTGPAEIDVKMFCPAHV